MNSIVSQPAHLRGFAAALLLAGAAPAYGADSYSGGRLTMPTLVIGNATYSDVVVTVGSIISGPAGSASIGTEDTYNPANGQLTVQAVRLGLVTVYNVIVTVSGLESIGGVTGADVYDGTSISAPLVDSDTGILPNSIFRPYGTPVIMGGMPARLYDLFTPDLITIPAIAYAGRVFTNVSVPATQVIFGSSNQTITFTEPPVNTAMVVGGSWPILATSSSGLAVSYVVQTPSVCTVVQSSAQQAYGFIRYSAAGGSGSGVVGAAPLGNGAFQANWFTGTDDDGQILGLALASSVLNPLAPGSPDYLPPDPNFTLGSWDFDDVLVTSAGPLLDFDGLLLTASDDKYINPFFADGLGYRYADSHVGKGTPQEMTFSGWVADGLVGLADGTCLVTAFQPGNSTFSTATPVTRMVIVGGEP